MSEGNIFLELIFWGVALFVVVCVPRAFFRARRNRSQPDYIPSGGLSDWFDFGGGDCDGDGGDCGGDGGD